MAVQPDKVPAYQQPVELVVAALRTDARQGLSDDEARRRLEQHGRNELATDPPVPAWRKFLAQFHIAVCNYNIAICDVKNWIWRGMKGLESLCYRRLRPLRTNRRSFDYGAQHQPSSRSGPARESAPWGPSATPTRDSATTWARPVARTNHHWSAADHATSSQRESGAHVGWLTGIPERTVRGGRAGRVRSASCSWRALNPVSAATSREL